MGVGACFFEVTRPSVTSLGTPTNLDLLCFCLLLSDIFTLELTKTVKVNCTKITAMFGSEAV